MKPCHLLAKGANLRAVTGPLCISLFTTSFGEVTFTSETIQRCPEAVPTTASLLLIGHMILVHCRGDGGRERGEGKEGGREENSEYCLVDLHY